MSFDPTPPLRVSGLEELSPPTKVVATPASPLAAVEEMDKLINQRLQESLAEAKKEIERLKAQVEQQETGHSDMTAISKQKQARTHRAMHDYFLNRIKQDLETG